MRLRALRLRVHMRAHAPLRACLRVRAPAPAPACVRACACARVRARAGWWAQITELMGDLASGRRKAGRLNEWFATHRCAEYSVAERARLNECFAAR